MGFLVALRFLTTISVPWVKEIKPRDRGASLAFFPLVGLILGLILVFANILLGAILPATVVNVGLIIILILLTGALHLDGLMDTCDGAFASRAPEERLQIMKDVKVGAFGIAGVVSILLLKWVSLDAVELSFRLPVLVFMPMIARWAMVYAVCAYPAAKAEGMGADFKKHAGWGGFVIATLLTAAVAMAIALLVKINLVEMMLLIGVLLAAVWLLVSGLALFLKRRLGGLTGDNYGAIAEVSEIAVMIFTFAYLNIRILIG